MLSVGVLVDLKCCPEAGGQVKCWERFAEAAGSLSSQLDLTLHFLGDEEKSFAISENVRYVTHPPLLSTTRFRSMSKIAEHTDLAPFQPSILPYLSDYDVVHTTDAYFAMAKTAMRFSRKTGKPLVNSIHTDMPAYTKIYAPQIIERFFKNGWLARYLLGKLQLDSYCSSAARRRFYRYVKGCEWIFVSKAEDLRGVSKVLLDKRVSYLRRGINKEIFHPKHRDRERLGAVLGIPKDRFLLLFVGRVAHEKNLTLLTQISRILLDQNEPVHLLMVGNGADRQIMESLLGPAATFTGFLPQERLPWIYASSDLFVFPSETEVYPNVVLEAKASGLPVLVSSKGGSSQCVKNPGTDGFVINNGCPDDWAELIKGLRLDPNFLRGVGFEARKMIENEGPSWRDVLINDLMPIWNHVANEGSPDPRS
jgi:glycosyltransferase involved in cell wall biosynthesis